MLVQVQVFVWLAVVAPVPVVALLVLEVGMVRVVRIGQAVCIELCEWEPVLVVQVVSMGTVPVVAV